MGYCTVDDIRADFKAVQFLPYDGTVGAVNSSTTQEQLQEWIDQESDYIDGRIANIYQLPINTTTYPQAGSILKRICIFRVSARVKNKNELKEEITQKNSDEKYLQNYVRTPNDDLEMIASDKITLIGVPKVDEAGGFDSFASDIDYCERKFNTCKQQW